MSSSRYRYASGDGLEISGHRWDPAGTPAAVVQLTHGMGEHVLRYEELAGALNRAGFVVYGQDHRGHGETAGAGAGAGPLGDLGPGGWPALVSDIGLLTAKIRAEHPGLPLFLLAHSMGSFAAQQYLLDHSRDVDGAVLTGTASIDLPEPALDLGQPLDLTVFNAAFQPARTDYDWLTRDEAIVDAYLADPKCGFGIDTVRVYPGARHEILNETNRAEVVADLISWLSGAMDSARS